MSTYLLAYTLPLFLVVLLLRSFSGMDSGLWVSLAVFLPLNMAGGYLLHMQGIQV